MKTILVTGGAGFIGSNFVIYFFGKYPDLTVINLDKLTYAGTPDSLREIEGHPRHFFVEGDITNQKLVGELFLRYRIDGVIHLAAELHVDNSIPRPSEFITTSINGTFTYHCRALDLIYHKGRAGETYNIRTRNEVRNLDLARKLCGIRDTIAQGKMDTIPTRSPSLPTVRDTIFAMRSTPPRLSEISVSP